jgi:hypothetical protein
MDIVGDYLIEGELELDPVWAVIFGFGLVVYLTLRTLKKRTRLLHVEGR